MNRWRAITLAALPVVAGACTWVLCFKVCLSKHALNCSSMYVHLQMQDWLTWSLDGMYASCAVVYAYWTDMRRLAAFVQEKEEHQEPPPYEHLRIRTKPLFPWYASVTRSSGRTQAQLPSHLRATLSLSAVPEGTPPSNRGCKLYCYSTCSEARWWQNVATPSVA